MFYWVNIKIMFKFFHAVKTSPEEVQSVTLNDRRNTRLTFVKANNYNVGLNLVKKQTAFSNKHC